MEYVDAADYGLGLLGSASEADGEILGLITGDLSGSSSSTVEAGDVSVTVAPLAPTAEPLTISELLKGIVIGVVLVLLLQDK